MRLKHVVVLLILFLGSQGFQGSLALADGIAVSQATLDWSGLTYTITGSLVVTPTVPFSFASSYASTTGTTGTPLVTVGGTSADLRYSSSFPQTWANTSAFSGYSTTSGNAFTQAATANGFLASSSQAATTSLEWSNNFAQSSARTFTVFPLYGTGVGSLTVTVPYTLSAACNISSGPIDNQSTVADASVSLEMGPGIGPNASRSVSCQDIPGITEGDLTLSMNFDNPTFGPLVDIDASAETDAYAHVPEPPTMLLLACGLFGWFVIDRRRLSSKLT